MKKIILILSILVLRLQANPDVGFVFFGDFGSGSYAQKQVASGIAKFCQTENCEFIASLGDNFYPFGVLTVQDPQWKTKFENIYGSLGLKFYATLGNHDYLGNVLAQLDYTNVSPHWYMPRRYYSYKFGEAEFFALDSNRFDDPQRNWLLGGLNESSACWKIAYAHHPIYSYGEHGSTGPLIHDLEPILKGRADFYLAGHEHDKQVIEAQDGVHYVVTGTGGAELRPTHYGPGTQFARSTYGFSHLSIVGREATLKVVNTNGQVEYSKTYTKSPSDVCP